MKRRIYKRYTKGKRGGQHYVVGGKKSKYSRGPKPKRLIKLKAYHTTFIQDKKTGIMMGRKSVEGVGDRTAIKIDPNTGRIFGRSRSKL